MKAFRRILCATDFSRASRPALDRAIALARQSHSTLSIAHVVSRFVVPFGDGFVSPVTYEAIDRRAHQHAQKQLAALVTRARKAGVRATGLLLNSMPHEQIPRAARRAGADLIVIGTHGHTGFFKLLLGSVAEQIIRLAPCPVLTVRSR